jgi:hypothetical protein
MKWFGDRALHTTKYIKHAGTVDYNLLFWCAGTFYIQTLPPMPFDSQHALDKDTKGMKCALFLSINTA